MTTSSSIQSQELAVTIIGGKFKYNSFVIELHSLQVLRKNMQEEVTTSLVALQCLSIKGHGI